MGCRFPFSLRRQENSSNSLLLSSKSYYNAIKKKLGKRTLLHAIEKGDENLCEKILGSLNIDPNIFYQHNFKRKGRHPKKSSPRSINATLLHFACIYRRDKIIYLLLTKGANPNLKDDLGRTPLQLVIDKWPHFWYLFYERDYIVETPENEEYLEHLHMQSISCIEYLALFGADVNAMLSRSIGTPADYGETPLHLAVRQNFKLALNELLKNGAELEGYDSLGQTPLMIACLKQNCEIIKTLLHLGADINSISKDGYTNLHLVCRYNPTHNKEVITTLLLFGADINAHSFEGNTPLHYAAAFSDNSIIIATLMYFGADPDALNDNLESPLFTLLNKQYSCLQDKLVAFVMLCSESANLRIVDAKGNLPWLLKNQNLGFLKQYFLISSKNPFSLQRLCRLKIRRTLGFRKLWHLKYNKIPIKFKNIFGTYPAILVKYILDWDADFMFAEI